jgi:hypothetical protein
MCKIGGGTGGMRDGDAEPDSALFLRFRDYGKFWFIDRHLRNSNTSVTKGVI